jgi:ABC-type phosphate transport system permease subunit
MRGSVWTVLKWGLIVTALVLVLAIILINFTSSKNLPELVRVQVERYAVCSYWFFGWHLASTGAFAFVFLLIGFLSGLGLGVFLARRA